MKLISTILAAILLSACGNSRPPNSADEAIEADGFLKNKSGEKIFFKQKEIRVHYDKLLSDEIINGCNSAVHTINEIFDKDLLVVDSNDTNPHIQITQGSLKSKNDSHQASAEFNFSNSEMLSAKITFDTKFQFSQAPKMNQFDAESICLHELGHSLGLSHSHDPLSVMYYGIQSSQKRRDLSEEDKNKLVTLYGLQ